MALTDLTHRNVRLSTSAKPRVSLWRLADLWRSRRTLSHLDAEQLADLGLTRKEAAREAARHVWDVPDSWRN